MGKLFQVAVLVAGTLLRCSLQDEAPMVRNYLQMGGRYVENAAGEHVWEDQMYVEHLSPTSGSTQPYPLVLFHGAAQTATNWLNKPDGGRGWASLFLEQGYELYLVDTPSRGRSAWQPDTGPTLEAPFSAEFLQRSFTAVARYNLYPQAAKHTQWNGTGLMGDPVFDRFYSSQVQYTRNLTHQQLSTQAAGAALLDHIARPAVLLGHSTGAQMPIVIADARPDLAAGLILLEPYGAPFTFPGQSAAPERPWGVADIPLSYDPAVADPAVDLVRQNVTAPEPGLDDCILQADSPAPRRLRNLADKPILIVTAEASNHGPYDYCTAGFLRQAGCSLVEHVELWKAGIHGNAHLMFLEMNSDEVQNVLREWLSSLHA